MFLGEPETTHLTKAESEKYLTCEDVAKVISGTEYLCFQMDLVHGRVDTFMLRRKRCMRRETLDAWRIQLRRRHEPLNPRVQQMLAKIGIDLSKYQEECDWQLLQLPPLPPELAKLYDQEKLLESNRSKARELATSGPHAKG